MSPTTTQTSPKGAKHPAYATCDHHEAQNSPIVKIPKTQKKTTNWSASDTLTSIPLPETKTLRTQGPGCRLLIMNSQSRGAAAGCSRMRWKGIVEPRLAPTSLSQPAKRRRTARGQGQMKHANVTSPQSPQSLTSPRTPSKPANISPHHFFKNKPLPETDTLGSRPARLPAERSGPENSWRRGRQLCHALQKAGNNPDKHTATPSRRSPENRPCRPHVFRANALA